MGFKTREMGQIIGIKGSIKSGKDEVTKMLQYLMNGNYKTPSYDNYLKWDGKSKIKNIKFAGKIKEMLATMLGVTLEKFEDREFKDTVLEKYTLIEYMLHSQLSGNTRFVTISKHLNDINDVKNEFDEIVTETEIKVTPRWLMYNIGTRAVRNVITKDWWIITTLGDYDKDSDNWVVSDVRFNNEKNAIEKLGGLNIGLKRRFNLRYPEYAYLVDVTKPYDVPDGLRFVNSELYDTLLNESEISTYNYDCDYNITNDSTLEELFENILKIYLEIKK